MLSASEPPLTRGNQLGFFAYAQNDATLNDLIRLPDTSLLSAQRNQRSF
jgi:hypothetical protein